ncbi:hypothetical protein [Dictyobacter formicarum]|uniref:PPE family domain-containing protein n=1 Tax=Dictyobacter formicarum TaxID=2778368 RepID=A0ABQ3VKY1_9CHLR|nr:hypothetical protein [Dictyobacter formicarum]GHO86488.1 hypothetical protein KSZ_44940 [Dictyobacter formicarum]
MEETKGKNWFLRVLDFINPLRDPSLTVAAVLTFIEEAGQQNPWYIIIVIALVNWLAVRGIVWLVVNFTFATVFIGRRVWWSVQHPRLAWRILDAVGHEEIVIGGNSGLTDSIMLQDGTTIMSPLLGANGIHVIGELPAGTELPMLGMPGGQMPSEGMQPFNGSGFFPGAHDFSPNGFAGQPAMNYQPAGNNTYNNEFVSTQSTDGLPQSFAQRPSQEEEQLRQQVAALNRLLEDWIQFTEEKWRTISDSQLGWKPLRGRWGNWDDIFQDAYAAKTSDPMAEAAQLAGEATARRYETSKDKGSAASAVACFMRDMMTLRRGLDMMQQTTEQRPDTPKGQPSVQPSRQFGGANSGSLFNGSTGNTAARSSLIRRPAQIFVDADSKK